MKNDAFDLGAMARQMRGPGMDTRVWLTCGVVTELGHDPKEGHFVDIRPVPTGQAFTCYVGQPYAGDDFGMHFPLKRGDTVLCAVPNGDSGIGPWIISRRWDASDKPPVEVGVGDEPVTAVVLKVEKGQDLRIIVSGGGKINIEARDNSSVEVTVGGDLTAKVTGDVLMEAQGNITAETQGDLTATATGNAKVKAQDVEVDAAKVHLGGETAIPLATYVDQNINAIAARVDSHQHSYIPSTMPAPTPVPTTPMVPPLPPLAAQMVPTSSTKVTGA